MEMKKCLMLLLALCMLMAMCAPAFAVSTADAREWIDVSRSDCTLTLRYPAGVPVRVFRVASVSADAQYTLAEEYPAVKLNGLQTQEEWAQAAQTLYAYAVANAIAPTAAAAGVDGTVRFTGLQTGLYLVAPVTWHDQTTQYDYAAFLISVPNLAADGRWSYAVEAKPKGAQSPYVPEPDEKSYTVVKLWRGEDAKRPDSVTIELFKDGKSAGTYVLNAKNDWSCSWTDASGASWTVVERNVPDGYTVSISGRTRITVVNTREDGNQPQKPDGKNDGGTPAAPSKPNGNSPYTGDTESILPYVLTLCASGAGLILLALSGRKKRHAES